MRRISGQRGWRSVERHARRRSSGWGLSYGTPAGRSSDAIRAILDYDTTRRQTGVSLYAYTPRPNTAIFVGYNDLLFNGIDPLDNTRARRSLRRKCAASWRTGRRTRSRMTSPA
ncbi:MAG: hypothetical protein H7Z38_00120 [Rubrivivax sp.]|nr:hypothetical protein [Pyrinomonadaceae bacterium]